MRPFSLLFFLLPSLLLGAKIDPLTPSLGLSFLDAIYSESLSCSPEASARRIQAYLLIGNSELAIRESQKALQNFPQDPLVFEWSIKSFAAGGEEGEMMKTWEHLHKCFPEKALEQDLLEEMCWGILKKGKKSTGLSSQLISLIGAALTQDIRALPFLLEGMRHTNAHIREISVELAGYYGDYPLKEEIRRLFYEELVLDIRLQVIKAIGKLKIDSLQKELIEALAAATTGAKEKLAIIEALIEIQESLGEVELKLLATSPRAGLRQLACEAIALCELKEASDLLLPLMQDPHPEVAAAALKTWGLLRRGVTEEIKKLSLEALDPLVGVTAAWVWLIQDPAEGEKAMLRWLESSQPRVRALAASAIAASGPYGIPLAKKGLESNDDPFVQANLALALAGQREDCLLACSALENALNQNRDMWMITENGIFQTLEKSTLSHNPAIANYPEIVNQTVQLELLNLLAILESPHALEAIKNFLKERHWGVTGLAAETLLGEGDETAIDLVRELLSDPDQDIRLEAALVLASWAKDYSALPILLEVYPQADRQLQLKILESLGRIGDRKAIPFLLERLKEPSLMVRMVAASVLIQTLNH